MSHVTGLFLIDAPASALNNAGQDTEVGRAENAVAVKFMCAPEGRYTYVSAQAVRYWLRTQLATLSGWSASPVFREEKVAYTDAEPTLFAEDDLFGYMRAPTPEGEKNARAAGATPLEEEKRNGKLQPVSITRISPFRVGTLVSTVPVWITRDFGTMARVEGNPVPHGHQFYRAHLKAGIGLDLTCAGTFFCSQRVGFRNISDKRIENAKKNGATEVTVRKLTAYRLPLPERQKRVAQLLRAFGCLDGGAKQALHLTDTAPSVLVLAVCQNGNQPFQRLFAGGDLDNTVFRQDVLEEALRVFKGDLQSDLYIGWAKGFLDEERKKLEEMCNEEAKPRLYGRNIHIGHPREMADSFAKAIEDNQNAQWFD